MKNKKRAAPPLRNGARDKEVIRWVKTHDVFDRLDTGTSELVNDHSDVDRGPAARRRSRQSRISLVGIGRSGRKDVAERVEELLGKGPLLKPR